MSVSNTNVHIRIAQFIFIRLLLQATIYLRAYSLIPVPPIFLSVKTHALLKLKQVIQEIYMYKTKHIIYIVPVRCGQGTFDSI